MDASSIYWITVADGLKDVGITLSVVAGTGLIVAIVETFSNDGEWTLVRWLSLIFALSICMGVFVPSAKTLAAMYVIPRIANNEKIKDLGNEAYDLALEWLRELKPSKSEKETEGKR